MRRGLAAHLHRSGPRTTLAGILVVIAAGAAAAPQRGRELTFRQPDGSPVPVRIWGDEYHQRVEDPDGYTLVRDPVTGDICFAVAVAGGGLASSGVRAGRTPPPGTPRHLELPVATVRARVTAARQRLARIPVDASGKRVEPEPLTRGEVTGLVLLVDFSDQPAVVPAADIDAYCNQPGYSGSGNNGSVRDYFYDVSEGRLDYANRVPDAYLRARYPKSHYEELPFPAGARELLAEALAALDADGLDFSRYDSNGDHLVDAVNLLYAGHPAQAWGQGLWPHSANYGFAADGVATSAYQITDVGERLDLDTFCHESGHVLCQWPDLYDYDFDSAGVGTFCLMGYAGPAVNPVEPCGPLKLLAGWTDTRQLAGYHAGEAARAGWNTVFVVGHPDPSNDDEFYLLENRQRAGRDAGLPDAGLAIWHVDWTGNNSFQEQLPGRHYMVTLVQADGRWDLENDIGYGDATDLWAAPAPTEFTPATSPAAVWWSGDPAALHLENISAAGPTMTFDFHATEGTLGLEVTVSPPGLTAPWRIAGPGGFTARGTGDGVVFGPGAGSYTLEWLAVPGWTPPPPRTLVADDDTTPLTFAGTYTDPPFSPLAAGPDLPETASRAVAVVDIDGDGDLDLARCDADGHVAVLRNEGGLRFVATLPDGLAAWTEVRATAWADVDGDGDQDVYLVRDGAANQLLVQQSDGSFVPVAAGPVGDAGAGRTAAWCDVDRDGRSDLYLVNDSDASRLWRGVGATPPDVRFAPVAEPLLANNRPGRAAVWADLDYDGDQDVCLVNRNAVAYVRRNDGAAGFTDITPGLLSSPVPGAAAAWGDCDGDLRLDLYVVLDGEPDRLFSQELGAGFRLETGPFLNNADAGVDVAWLDADNDGALDIAIARRDREPLLLLGDGSGGFLDAPLNRTDGAGTAAMAAGDLDGDGGVDLVLARPAAGDVILHNTGRRGHWLQIDLRGGQSATADGLGARVRIVAGGRSQLRETDGGGGSAAMDARRLAVGLADAAQADSVVIHWSPGHTQVLTGLAAGRRHAVSEPVWEEPPPSLTRLLPGYPNPFNDGITLAFDLDRPGPARLEAYDLRGRRVAILLAGDLAATRHQTTWDGRDDRGRRLASGTYLVRLQTAAGTWNRRVCIVR